MRTTVDIPDELYQRVASKAAEAGLTVGNLIADALRSSLERELGSAGQRIAFPLHHSAKPGALNVDQVGNALDAIIQQEDMARARAL